MATLILALMEDAKHTAEVKACLEDDGHSVHIVNSFSTAMAILKDHPFDLIISDVHLENGGSVFDFLRWVKGIDEYKTIPFVLFSLEPNRLAKYLADGVRAASRQ
ncbi:MAG: response regulator, partial [Candidatus Obscuribacterales bacterium]|nr:response regulator [Candidatus Obscuribacterales bacterium]